MATGQSVTGTGVFSEFGASIADFFGKQAGAYNEKINNGEQLCLTQLRVQCLRAGGNAVIGADIDYSEVGGDKGMLMVCMAGTIVKVLNEETLGKVRAASARKIQQHMERKEYLSKLVLPETKPEGGYLRV